MLKTLLLAATAGLALASPVSRREVPATHTLHERHAPHWAEHWSKRSKVPDDAVLPMRIGLTQQNLAAGHDRLMEISTPGSANYGKHMTPEEVHDFFAPSAASVDAVTAWITGHGIAADRIGLSVNRQWLQFDATTAEAEDLLYAEFYVFEHASGASDVSTEAYHVPEAVREHIDYVTPGVRLRVRRTEKTTTLGSGAVRARTNFGGVRPLKTKLSSFPHPNSSSCSTYVTANCTRNQYNIPVGTTAAKGNEMGIFESLDVHYSRNDLDVYFSTLYPHIPNGTYPEERLIDGAIGATEDTTDFVPIELEAPLDFDAAMPLIYPQGAVLFQEDDEYYATHGSTFMGFWNTFLDAIDGSYCTYSAFNETGDCTDPACKDPVYPNPNSGGYKGKLQCGVYTPTNVISISYGNSEGYWPDYYIKRQCNEWLKLGLQGTTVLMSSNDDGVGKWCNGPSGNVFDPDFGATCPYILAVGSTEWNRAADATGSEAPNEPLVEVATARFASGGGFSNVFDVPDYQNDSVAAYFAQVESSLPFQGYNHYVHDGNFSNVTDGLYNRGGRGYPDVSAVGDRQVIYANGSWWLYGGTSLAAPVFGSVLTLINEERIAAGKKSLGFIHNIIYKHPEAFNDITSGSNPGCGTSGFPAAKGWDPVTGLGSPNYPKLREILLAA
ncbi:alkaline serine protease [Grosmannia clavigera kw1407]|uniref:Alkaline serine protease n=1 Tax=Grosmannia clavigera (strain kw1407 / UAMH 11150) TaxID=655863 RepID=F0X741_GROCL|nr:alkaline serine protease [Grosmannia clavigera kw1407]EFX06237.1 alkaline serine protease [Grosmannia clavigera kw1407]